MALSAFKSTSKRGTLLTPTSPSSSSSIAAAQSRARSNDNHGDSPKKAPLRRSRSVSALASHQSLEIPPDVLNKRDNPLFSSSSSPQNSEIQSKSALGFSGFDETVVGFGGRDLNASNSAGGAADYRRGRSASRKADSGTGLSDGRSGIGRRSLSRVDTGRRGRSVSQQPVHRRVHYVTSESEVEGECGLPATHRSRNGLNGVSSNAKKASIVRNGSTLSNRSKPSPEWPNGHAKDHPSGGSASCTNSDDELSVSSIPDAEEKTIKAVFEQMKSVEDGNVLGNNASNRIYETVRSEVRRAICDIQSDLKTATRRKNASSLGETNIADISPDLVNPGAVELVLDIRRDYAKKLEESKERARKLRADVAIEEHRGLELSRILEEILPDSKSSNVQKSRPVRRSSIERRKMSKRLTDEAMAYFDECVSISTFDSSDFSAPEDPPVSTVPTTPVDPVATLLQGNPNNLRNSSPNICLNEKQDSGGYNQSGHSHGKPYSAESSSNTLCSVDRGSCQGSDIEQQQKSRFSLARKASSSSLRLDIKSYIKTFEKSALTGGGAERDMASKHYDADEYPFQAQAQNVSFQRVFYKNRLESGSLLLCAGGSAISLSPFALAL